MKKILLTTASALALATPSLAADVFDPVFDWTGPYVGLNVGAAIFTEDMDLEGGIIGAPVSSDDSETDVTFGVQAGYNFQADDLLLGIEGDFNYLDAGDDLLLAGKGTSTFESDHDWFATVRARAGLVSDQTLFYVTGGLAILDATYRLETVGFGADSDSSNEVLLGWTIGGGIEHAFSEDWSVKIEYLYADFESFDESIGAPAVEASADPSMHVIRAGVNYHF